MLALHSAVTLTVPTPPIWGGALKWRCTVNVTDATSAGPAYDFVYEYNSPANVSRYELSSGQHDEMCEGQFIGVASYQPCNITHATDGWSYVEIDGGCCQCSRLGIVKSDWLEHGANPPVYLGRRVINGVNASGWQEAGISASDNTYFAAAGLSATPDAPVQFYEHKQVKLKTWDFDLRTYERSPTFAPGRFDPPAGCNTKCRGSICRYSALWCSWMCGGVGEFLSLTV
tara:strand:+ start:1600 stop:2286 length:687 start_codon:yes stop_codon:yes gene_type:complete